MFDVNVYKIHYSARRIIIYVPRRIKTIHHHHHHVVLMEPPVKPNTEKSSSSSSSTTDEEYQVTKDRRVQHEQEEQEHHQESMAAAGHPLSYLEQRKAANADVSIYPAVHYPRYRTFATWPNRKKRSRVVARLYTTY